ncbi:MAG: hypothetical protein ABEJ40_05265 [Haloarculaceae archaeon]
MEPWGWILIYLVGFTLFQLLLFRFFSDGRVSGETSPGSGETTVHQSFDSGRNPREAVEESTDSTERGEGIRCPRCGTDNADEPSFTYCRNCLAQLH